MVGRARPIPYVYLNKLILSHINFELKRIHSLPFPHRQRIVEYESPQTENKFRGNCVQFQYVGIAAAMTDTVATECGVRCRHITPKLLRDAEISTNGTQELR